jgi:hypothetical protein
MKILKEARKHINLVFIVWIIFPISNFLNTGVFSGSFAPIRLANAFH